jgi:hypothetical protein
MKEETLTFECLLTEDKKHITVNFHSQRHEYSIGWEPYWNGVLLTLSVWHGSATHDHLAGGPLEAATWDAIKAAIVKEDAGCSSDYGHLS